MQSNQVVIDLVFDESTGSRVLRVAGELTVYHAAKLANDVWRRLGESAPLWLDLDGVTQLDSAGVQVLLVARRDAHERGLALRLLRPSPPVLEVFETLNLGRLIAELIDPTSEGPRT